MDREIQQLKQERDRYKSEFERNQAALQQANKKVTESLIQSEEHMYSQPRNYGNTSSSTVTLKSSQMLSSKTVDPNYRGEAFGK